MRLIALSTQLVFAGQSLWALFFFYAMLYISGLVPMYYFNIIVTEIKKHM